MRNKKNIDFVSGNIIWEMILFSIPIVFGELFQNLYNSVDVLVVGNFVGKTALAAVSVCATLVNMVVGFFNGMSMGASVVVSKAFGSRENDRLSQTIRVVFSFGIILGLTLSVIGVILTPMLVSISEVDEVIYNEAVTYLRIYLAGIVFTVVYNISAGILRAVGDSQTPFRILLITSTVNIVLDVVFVVVFHMGVAGVGVATIIAQAVSVILAYKKIADSYSGFAIRLREVFSKWSTVSELSLIGAPYGLQCALVSLSNVFIWRYVNRFGASATAGIGIAQRLDKFIAMPCKAFGMTITTFVSQNVGAKNYERARSGVNQCLALSIFVTMSIGSVVFLFSEQAVGLFTADPEVIMYGKNMVRVIVPLYFTMGTREIFLGTLRGYGNTRIPMVLSLLGMVVVRQIFLAVFMHISPSIQVIYACYPIAWISTAAMIYIYYRRVRVNYIS